MTSKGPFNPKPFYESMILRSRKMPPQLSKCSHDQRETTAMLMIASTTAWHL